MAARIVHLAVHFLGRLVGIDLSTAAVQGFDELPTSFCILFDAFPNISTGCYRRVRARGLAF
jgi:hypothetical protein